MATCCFVSRTLKLPFDDTVVFRVLRYYASVLEAFDVRDEHGEVRLEGREFTNSYYCSVALLDLSCM
jgi:hypothetical protein